MAAIAPHLEGYESSAEELDYASCAGGAADGLGGLAAARRKACVAPSVIVGLRHAGLVRMAMTRQAIWNELVRGGISYKVQWGRHDGSDPYTAYIVLDREIGERGPEWNSHQETLRNFKLLAWTSKMDAPSFSLPAGTVEVGGACPGAKAGQSTVGTGKDFVAMAALVKKLQPSVPAEPGSAEWLAGAICQSCLTGDTRVLVRGRGLTRLDELTGAFEVWSGIDWRSTRVIDQGERSVVTLHTHFGHTLHLTPDHRVLVGDDMVEVRNIDRGAPLRSFDGGPVPRVERIEDHGVRARVYDLVNVGLERHFVANGIIVSNCYAEGGNYAYSSKQLAAILIYDWCKRALTAQAPSGRSVFVQTMIEVIERADFRLDGSLRAPKDDADESDEPNYKIHPESPRYGRRFFRIHDSGDFWGKAYLRAWKEICDALPDIIFWAPTRIWAMPGGIDWVNEINSPPKNLIIRPSTYHINTPQLPALGPGWAAASTVFDQTHIEEAQRSGAFGWNCPAYAAQNKGHSCRAATAPDGQQGCRSCWVHPETTVNYKLH